MAAARAVLDANVVLAAHRAPHPASPNSTETSKTRRATPPCAKEFSVFGLDPEHGYSPAMSALFEELATKAQQLSSNEIRALIDKMIDYLPDDEEVTDEPTLALARQRRERMMFQCNSMNSRNKSSGVFPLVLSFSAPARLASKSPCALSLHAVCASFSKLLRPRRRGRRRNAGRLGTRPRPQHK